MNSDMVNKLELNKKDKDIDKSYKWLILIIILIFLITKLPNFFSFVDRDVGVFAYIGEQISNGSLLYKELWASKPPGVYYLNAFIFYILPNTFLSLRVFELIYSLFTIFVLYKLSRFFYTRKISLGVVAIYAFFSNTVYINSQGLMTETYMLLPMIFSIYFFKIVEAKRIPYILGYRFVIKLCPIINRKLNKI